MGFLFGLIINFYTFLMVLIILNIVAIILSVLGIHKEQKLKKEIRLDTKWAIFLENFLILRVDWQLLEFVGFWALG